MLWNYFNRNKQNVIIRLWFKFYYWLLLTFSLFRSIFGLIFSFRIINDFQSRWTIEIFKSFQRCIKTFRIIWWFCDWFKILLFIIFIAFHLFDCSILNVPNWRCWNKCLPNLNIENIEWLLSTEMKALFHSIALADIFRIVDSIKKISKNANEITLIIEYSEHFFILYYCVRYSIFVESVVRFLLKHQKPNLISICWSHHRQIWLRIANHSIFLNFK